MSKRFLLIMAAFVVVFIGILTVNKRKAAAPMPDNGTNSAQLTNHTSGSGKKNVTLIEYGDLACPACYQYYPLVEAVREKYKEEITFQFRHFPLVEIHQNALIAAKAAEAADLQGKFWEMYSKLYENQPSWRESKTPQQFFDDFATQLGLDLNKFHEDMRSDSVNAIVQADRADAKKRGFSGTPTFVLDGKHIDSPRDVDGFSKLIDEAIKAKNPETTTQEQPATKPEETAPTQ